jgi:hypothetical protein
MAIQTQQNDADVNTFLSSFPEQQQDDCKTIMTIMAELTNEPPKMWGEKIIGFGSYHYKYKSGQEGDWFLLGVSPRKSDISIQTMAQLSEEPLLEQLGKEKHGRSCIYVKKLEDIDTTVLKKILKKAMEETKKTYC